MSDEEILEKVRNLPEAQAFYERYTPFVIIWQEGTTTYVRYEMVRTWDHGNDPTMSQNGFEVGYVTKTLLLTVSIDSFGGTTAVAQCVGELGLTWPVSEIKTTGCLEVP